MVVKKKRKGRLSVDFTGVESGGFSVADGLYRAYPVECEEKEGEDSGEPYLAFKWKITGKADGGKAGGTIWDNCSLQPQALWRIKTLLELWEIEAEGAVELDPADLIGEDKEITIEVTNEKFKGKDKPRISGFSALESDRDQREEEEEEEEEEKPVKKKSGGKTTSKTSSKKEEAEEEEEEEAEEEEEEEKPPAKKDTKLGKKPKLKEGARVQFEDENGKTVKGTITEIDGDTVKVEDKGGDQWELDADQVEVL